ESVTPYLSQLDTADHQIHGEALFGSLRSRVSATIASGVSSRSIAAVLVPSTVIKWPKRLRETEAWRWRRSAAICNAALSADRCTACAGVIDGPINGALFRGYIEQLHVPGPSRGETVVIDNIGSHR